MTTRTLAESFPSSFWVIAQGHSIIPDGTRYLVMARWQHNNELWVAWRDGIAPQHLGALLREEHFQREERKEQGT